MKRANSHRKRNQQDFLLEIGCEELPADYMPAALEWPELSEGLGASAVLVFGDKKKKKTSVVWKQLQSFGTPRRLVLLVKGIEPIVTQREDGPPVRIAFDAQGKPTLAAQAFAQRNGLKVSQLVREKNEKGIEVVSAQFDEPVTQVLARAIPEIIQGIRFPKMMRWDDSGVRFARPIRWLLALYGDEVVRCQYGGVKSGNVTYTTRRAGSRLLRIASVKSYFLTMDRCRIDLEEGRIWTARLQNAPEPKKRMRLLKSLEGAAKKCGGQLPDQGTEEFEWLLDTATFLAEDPVVQVGSFRPEYLGLPAEVLATSMAKHLKLFSIYSTDRKKLLPKFLAILEGKPGRPARVMANYERILEARFTDARFFYQEDTKSPLKAKVPELATVAFHEKLGSVKERVGHLYPLMVRVASDCRFPTPVSEDARRAAELCKADLVTQMVKEFPSLQGIIGGRYAKQSGESDGVAQAITEHYRPRTAEDPVPTTLLGAMLGLVDRLDTLVGFFCVGLKPTGSMDPYALRRQALGIVRILIEIKLPNHVSFVGLSIDRLLDEGIKSWGSRLSVESQTLKKELHIFLLERFEWLCKWRYRIDPHLVEAVLSADSDDLAGAWERLEVLRRLWGASGDGRRRMLEQAANVAERTSRIVKSVKGVDLPSAVDMAVLKDPVEKDLWTAWRQVAPQVLEQLKRRQFEEATRTYSTLYPTVHTFFEKVFVMDENLELRRNRLALMKEIYQTFSDRFADLSKLPLAGVEPS